jgi:copper(I)-binding protein
MRPITLAALAVLTLAPALALPGAGHAAEPGITVKQPWMRLLIKARPAAGYMTIENAGDTPRDLTGASSPACGQLMLHQSMEKGGQDMMQMVPKITIPPHGSVSFSPGGYHLMCMQPAATMKVGATVPVTLMFADGGSVAVDVPVKGARGP